MATPRPSEQLAKAPSTLGERVRAARRELGMSQAQLAGSELTKGFISQLESGSVRPSIRSLQTIANRLAKPLDYFLADAPLAAGKRLAFHRLAADAAAERRDWAGVRHNVEIGLEQAPDAREKAQLLYLLARADAAERHFEKAFESVNEAWSFIDVASDPTLAAQLLYVRGYGYGELGKLVAATEAYEACRDVIERHEVIDPRLRARLLVALGTMYRRLNRTTKALSSYESALAIASRSSELTLAARGYMGIAASHYDSGELDAAINSYRRALELFQRASDVDLELSALQSIAIVQLEKGDPVAPRSAERAMRRALEVGNAHAAAIVEVILARIALNEERPDDALRMAKHAEKVLGGSGDQRQRADALGAIGAAYEKLGKTAEADRAYRKSLETYTSVGDYADRSGMAAEYGRVLRARGDIDAAFDMLELARGAQSKT